MTKRHGPGRPATGAGVNILIRVPAEFKELLQQEAASLDRSFSAYCRHILESRDAVKVGRERKAKEVEK